MTDMKRLLDDSIPPGLEKLLRSMEREVPGQGEKRRNELIAAMLAVPASAHASPAPLRGGLLVWIAKWGAPGFGLVLAGAFALLSGFSMRSTPAGGAPRAEATSRAEKPPVQTSAARELPPSEMNVGVAVDELPSAAPNERMPSRRGTVKTAAIVERRAHRGQESGEQTFDNELAVIDAARASLASGRSSEVLSLVRAYRSRFPNGHFGNEADALEIQALGALGPSDEARRKAEQFLSAHPQSPYTQRVRAAAGMKE